MKIRTLLAATMLVALPVITLLDLPSGGTPAAAQAGTGQLLFLKLDGVEGSATLKGHEKQIELNSYAMHVAAPAAVVAGGGVGAGKTKLESFTVTKDIDASTAALFDLVAKGKHVQKATLTVRSNGVPSNVIVSYELTDIVLSSYQVSSSGALPAEALQLSFAAIKTTVTPPSGGKGGAAPATVSSYSFAAGK